MVPFRLLHFVCYAHASFIQKEREGCQLYFWAHQREGGASDAPGRFARGFLVKCPAFWYNRQDFETEE